MTIIVHNSLGCNYGGGMSKGIFQVHKVYVNTFLTWYGVLQMYGGY